MILLGKLVSGIGFPLIPTFGRMLVLTTIPAKGMLLWADRWTALLQRTVFETRLESFGAASSTL